MADCFSIPPRHTGPMFWLGLAVAILTLAIGGWAVYIFVDMFVESLMSHSYIGMFWSALFTLMIVLAEEDYARAIWRLIRRKSARPDSP
jgi:heme A synthase